MRTTIGELLSKRAFVSPDGEAFVDVASGRRFTFAELDELATTAAAGLAGLGVGKGDRVALLCMNSPEFVAAYLGCARLGAVTVPLNWRLTPEELAFIVDDSGASAMVFSADFAPAAAALAPRCPSVRCWVQVDGADAFEGVHRLDEVLAAAPAPAPLPDVEEDDLLYLMYTSGTTGRPKGAMHTHATTFAAMLNMVQSMDYRTGDRYLNCMPLFHVGALQPLNVLIYRGGTTVLMRAFDPGAVWQLIDDESVSSLLAVPAMLTFMADTYDPGTHRLPALRWIITAGSPVPVSLLERYVAMGIEIHQGYGLTECGGPATILSGADAVAKLGSAGKAFFHADVAVVDPDGKPCPPGEAGEVVIRSSANMTGYWNRPEATESTLRDGWLHTGDVAAMDSDGFVTILDRLTDMIITGGENVYPAEVEDAILAHPGVLEVAVIAQASDRWGESPCAVVVRSDPSLSEADVVAWCQGRLARYKQPRTVVFTDTIPRNPSGKALKRLLREQFPGPSPE